MSLEEPRENRRAKSSSPRGSAPLNKLSTILHQKLINRTRAFLTTILTEGPQVFPHIHCEGLEVTYLSTLTDIVKRNASKVVKQEISISYVDALEIMIHACPVHSCPPTILSTLKSMLETHRRSGEGATLRTIAYRNDEYAKMAEMWYAADTNNSGTVDFKALQVLADEYRMDLSSTAMRRIFDEADVVGDGEMGYQEFVHFFVSVNMMRELRPIFTRYATAVQGQEMCLADMFRFLRCEQHEDIPLGGCFYENPIDPVLLHLRLSGDNGLDFSTGAYGRSTGKWKSVQHDAPVNALHITQMYSLWHFQKYLTSAQNTWIDTVKLRQETHDMDRPLGEYFINSSHNTYLSGDQLMSESKCEMYRDCLLQGCRCVEIDCWDGTDGDPIVYHGWTRTTKIRFRDVIETIHRYSFVTSPYPVILSLEVHTNRTQQKRMAQIMIEIFGSRLVTSELHNTDQTLDAYFTPKRLMYKILVKHKQAEAPPPSGNEAGTAGDGNTAGNEPLGGEGKPFMGDGEEAGDEEDEIQLFTDIEKSGGRSRDGSRDLSKGDRSSGKASSPGMDSNFGDHGSASVQIAPDANQKDDGIKLSYLVSLSSVKVKGVDPGNHPPYSIVSLPETRIDHYERVPDLAQGLIQLNKQMFTRIYPKGTRVDSSNYYPQASWNLGCSFVALNFQKPDFPMRLNRRVFLANGRTGYLLKPRFLRDPSMIAPPLDCRILHVQVIAAMHLPQQSISRRRKKTFDPHVELIISGFGTDDTSANSARTNILHNNSWHPIWQQDFKFEINCLDLATLTIRVMDHDPVRSELVGENTAPVRALRQGYRRVPLYDVEENEIPMAFLLCRFRLVSSQPIPSWL